jgi:hypothetical protein
MSAPKNSLNSLCLGSIQNVATSRAFADSSNRIMHLLNTTTFHQLKYPHCLLILPLRWQCNIFKYLIKLMVELGQLPRKYSIFYNENQLLYNLLIKIFTTDFMTNNIIHQHIIKLVLIGCLRLLFRRMNFEEFFQFFVVEQKHENEVFAVVTFRVLKNEDRRTISECSFFKLTD